MNERMTEKLRDDLAELKYPDDAGIPGHHNMKRREALIIGFNAAHDLLMKDAEALVEALRCILKKNPGAVGIFEAADMAVEFHMTAHKAITEWNAKHGEKK